MKILVFGDVHWSSYSSIIRSRGTKYSTRLENLISSLNWVTELAYTHSCNGIVCLGDFFDKAELNSEEITALEEWKLVMDIPYYFLVGNHEAGRSSLEMSSAHVMSLTSNCYVISEPSMITDYWGNEICFLPYIFENARRPLAEYFPKSSKKRVIFSHNDLSGVQMGKFVSKDGFSLDEIADNCTLFVNGHLHNASCPSANVVNLGNLSGQNFSEDAMYFNHCAMILDTETFKVDYYENPYAFNFYKFDFSNCNDDKFIQMTLDKCKSNSVVTIKVNTENKFTVEDLLSCTPNIIEARIIVDMSVSKEVEYEKDSMSFSVDHIKQFDSFIREQLGSSKEVLEELRVVTGGIV